MGISRASLYYKPVSVSANDLELMRRIDEIHLKYPFYGSRNIWDEQGITKEWRGLGRAT